MATLEDKILGEKLHNYCSSSEESDNENSDSEGNKKTAPSEPASAPEINKWEGTSTNTGPKGVIKDWQKYKQLETEKRDQEEKEKIELMKKLTLTVRTVLDEEKLAIDDPELSDIMDEEFLLEYQKKRIQEMLQQTNHNVKFGNLIFLKTGQEFLDAIDKESKSVIIIVHIYEDFIEACRTMNSCLKVLAKLYENVKFCALHCSEAGMSRQFRDEGIPALLVYKSGNLVGNFIRIIDDLGNDFLPEDVQGYLVEHGFLEDKSCTPLLIKGAPSDSDSD